jgi:hypothetical protein
MSRDSVGGITTGYGLKDLGVGVRVPVGSRIFFFSTSRPPLESTQFPLQGVLGAFSPGAKRPGREADHSLPSSADINKEVDLYIHFPIRLHDVVLH